VQRFYKSGKPGFWCKAPKMRPKQERENSYAFILQNRKVSAKNNRIFRDTI
jgi:hypothetical protein